MTPLPIDAQLPTAIDSLRKAHSLVLVAPPGAGKTTRFPPALLDSGLLAPQSPAVVVLQPRRVAARATAARIAYERGCALGFEVGYHVRLDKKTGPATRLRVLTEGILTRHLLDDPFLEGVGAVVLDEFHERSLHTDLALAMLKEAREAGRDDLFLVVMSATLQAEPVAAFLDGCPVVRVESPTYPVALSYVSQPPRTPLHKRAAQTLENVLDGPADAGHVLVFLPGAEEIRRTAIAIAGMAERAGAIVLPLHGRLPAEEQDLALAPSERRKIVLATNVAETSLTIDGVRTVIDTGYAREASIDNARGLDRLDLVRISRASADQRAGRAGRTAPGRCYRLWSESEHKGLPADETPEIERVDLSSTVLDLHAWGVADPREFAWFEPPPEEALGAAERLLVDLGAIDCNTRRISPLGRRIERLPVHPRLARIVLASIDIGQPRLGATVAAILAERDILRPRGGASETRAQASASARSDLLPRIDLLHEAEQNRFAQHLKARGIDPFAARQVARARDELLRSARIRSSGSSSNEWAEDDLLRLILLAYPDRVARRRGPGDSTGRMVGGRGVRLDRSSLVRESELFVALDPMQDRRGRALEARVRLASAIELDWLLEFFPQLITEENALRVDEDRGRVVAERVLRYRDLVIRESPHGAVDPIEAGAILAAALRPRARDWIAADEPTSRWLVRYENLRAWMPELGLPAFEADDLSDALASACAGRKTFDEVRSVPLVPLLQGRLTHAQARALDDHAPEFLEVPSGSRLRLQYEAGRSPSLAVRIQEIFGWTTTPRVGGGRIPVLLHLLGPNYRPVQITDDLQSFWNTTYLQVRKDLRARYPRHAWPENPWTARAEAKGGRRKENRKG
jgi:ATP-dependent helicase HrpB